MSGDEQNSPLPEEHHAAVGKVAAAWADLEFEIDCLIWEIIHDKRLVWQRDRQVARFQISAKRKLVFEPLPETVADLDKFRSTVREVTARFLAAADAIRVELHSSRDKPPQPPLGKALLRVRRADPGKRDAGSPVRRGPSR
jgi:hypothetical protein